MKTITLTLAMLLIGISSLAQWTEQNTAPTLLIEKFNFVNDDLGYALTYVGSNTNLLIKTTDGGATWSDVDLPISNTAYFALDFFDDGKGVVVYRDLSNSVTPTMIYRTLNDGVSWENITPDSTQTGMGMAAACFFDENNGYFGVGEILYTTLDGGTTWSEYNVNGGSSYYTIQSLDFVDMDHGTVGLFDGTFAYMGAMYGTADGGATWNRRFHTKLYTVADIVIQTSQNTSYAATTNNGASGEIEIYRSDDNGDTWDTIAVPDTLPNVAMQSFDFINDVIGMAVLQSNSDIYFYETHDGGSTWSLNDTLQNTYCQDFTLTTSTGYFTSWEQGSYYKLSQPLSIVSSFDVASFQVYPNPVTRNGTLFWNESNGISVVVLRDLSGKEVLSTENAASFIQVNDLPSGIYIIELRTDEKRFISRFMVQ